MHWYQQGDVTLKPATVPAHATRTAAQDGRHILRSGEATGHHHAVAAQEEITLYTLGEILYMVNTQPVELTHQEHRTISIPPGTWVIDAVREYDYMEQEVRYVKD